MVHALPPGTRLGPYGCGVHGKPGAALGSRHGVWPVTILQCSLSNTRDLTWVTVKNIRNPSASASVGTTGFTVGLRFVGLACYAYTLAFVCGPPTFAHRHLRRGCACAVDGFALDFELQHASDLGRLKQHNRSGSPDRRRNQRDLFCRSGLGRWISSDWRSPIQRQLSSGQNKADQPCEKPRGHGSLAGADHSGVLQ